ncbi:extracellular solute-binding protein [Amylibacter sp.]|nr:extracellular solute-binding protein [Amylibacter sp.]
MILLGCLAFLIPSSSALAEDMIIVSRGGAYTASQQAAYYEPYAAITGVNIIINNSSGEAVVKLRAMSKARNVTWDVVDVVAADALLLCDEGLAMEIDADTQLADAPDGTKAKDDFGDLLINDCFIPQMVYSTTFGYRKDLVGSNAPTSVCSVFDTAAYPGKRSLEKRPINNMEWALMCDGVAKRDVYDVLATDEGQDRAFAKLDTIKANVIWSSAGADTPRLLADGKVIMGSAYNSQLFILIEEQGQNVDMLWDSQIFGLFGLIIPDGLSNERKARALDFVYFATETERLADQAKYISYGPARKSSVPLVSKHATLRIDMLPHMPTNPNNAKNSLLYNYSFWKYYYNDIDAKFQAWLAR